MRKTVTQSKDHAQILKPAEYQQLVRGTVAMSFATRFKELNDHTIVAPKDFVTLRDYLIIQLLLSSAQRPGAVANLTVQEFQSGTWDKGTDQFITFTSKHKTPSLGPASFSWDKELHSFGVKYLSLLRPIYATNASRFHSSCGTSWASLLYFKKWTAYGESTGHATCGSHRAEYVPRPGRKHVRYEDSKIRGIHPPHN